MYNFHLYSVTKLSGGIVDREMDLELIFKFPHHRIIMMISHGHHMTITCVSTRVKMINR